MPLRTLQPCLFLFDSLTQKNKQHLFPHSPKKTNTDPQPLPSLSVQNLAKHESAQLLLFFFSAAVIY